MLTRQLVPPGAVMVCGAFATGCSAVAVPADGYGIAIQRQADVTGTTLTIHARFMAPADQPPRTPLLTSPCELIMLPEASHYAALHLVDSTGAGRAGYPDAAAPATAVMAVPAQ